MAVDPRASDKLGTHYRCEVCLHPEPEGGFSVYVPGLPGVVSEGETRQEAIRNIREALDAVLQTYGEDRQPIPWRRSVQPAAEREMQTYIPVAIRLSILLGFLLTPVGCREQDEAVPPPPPPGPLWSAFAAAEVSAVEVALAYPQPKGLPTTKTVRSEDRSAIAEFLKIVDNAVPVPDCKCGDVGGVRLRGPTLDVSFDIMPGHTRGHIDLHGSDHKRWRLPLDRFGPALERLGVEKARAVLGKYDDH